ncbi:thioesterase family protein [Usnea florida]
MSAPPTPTPQLHHLQTYWAKQLPTSPIYTFLLSTITLVSASPGSFTATLAVQPCHVNSKGTLHGSVSACLIDWAGGMAIATDGRESTGVSTDIQMSCVGAAREGDVLEVEGWVRKVGGSLAFTGVEVRREGGGVVATGSHTKYVKG